MSGQPSLKYPHDERASLWQAGAEAALAAGSSTAGLAARSKRSLDAVLTAEDTRGPSVPSSGSLHGERRADEVILGRPERLRAIAPRERRALAAQNAVDAGEAHLS